jgi:hypothetical protein
MKLIVQTPRHRWPEKSYVCATVLGEFLGLDFELQAASGPGWKISCGDDRELLMPDLLFEVPQSDWLQAAAMPRLPLRWIEPGDLSVIGIFSERLPVLYGSSGDGGAWVERRPEGLSVGIDILGACFFMLSRYEEIVDPSRDAHDRFPAQASIAFREGFLDRPIVDEYANLLWGALVSLWPQLRRRRPNPCLRVSHDVDAPFLYAFQSASRLARSIAGDVIRRRKWSAAISMPRDWLRVKLGADGNDPYYTFDWIMDRSEAASLRSTFNFICGHGPLGMDGDYNIEHPRMRRLLRRIHERGHEIGLHGSYETLDQSDRLAQEFERLRRVCGEEGIAQDRWGGRQHYLRWRMPITARAWVRAGLDYDASLGFAEAPGFRSGTSREHALFDAEAGRVLALRERPLLAMDATLLDRRYLALDNEAALERLLLLRGRAESHGGDFNLLWHNNRLVGAAERRLYEAVLPGA